MASCPVKDAKVSSEGLSPRMSPMNVNMVAIVKLICT